jgi:hypothetical protein
MKRTSLCVASACALLTACGGGSGGGGGGGGGGGTVPPPPAPPTADTQLRPLITTLGLTGDPSTGRNLPSISDPLPQLGMKLFFSKSLSGDFDTACASCHHHPRSAAATACRCPSARVPRTRSCSGRAGAIRRAR